MELDGRPAWVPGGDTTLPNVPATGARLLPYFDSYLIACHPRQSLFSGQATARALNRTGQAGTLPVLLVDGAVAGVWHQRRTSKQVHLTVEPFAELTAAQLDGLHAEARRLGEFLAEALALTIGPVTTDWHA